MPDAMVRIELLASPSVTVGDAVVDRFPTQRLVALLAYLALHPTWKPREQIAEAVWPDQPDGKALASLRNGLSMLRRIIEPSGASVLETSRTHARLVPGSSWCDAIALREAIKKSDHNSAVALYQGDLLPDLYDEWLEPLRDEFRTSFHIALAAEGNRLFSAQDAEKSLFLAGRWLQSDPYDVEAIKLTVLSLAALGRAPAAVAALEKFTEESGDVASFDAEELRTKIAAQPRFDRPISPDRRLPVYLSRFFGRERELTEIERWSQSNSSLLTILGTGGIGKTRLSVEAARSKLDGYDIVFIPLAGADSRIAMIAALMQAFELRELDNERPEETVRAELARRTRPTILVLDNLEQIAPIAASVVLELLPANGKLKFLCTSRELLGIEGEQLLRLSPFESDLEQEGAAVQMFIDRARNTRSDFALTERNHDDVLALCGELDGLPLAIEIVAAWAGAWSVAQMRANVRDNKIVSRKRGHDDRHRSLEACIEWSFNLLEPEAQRFLCIQSLFRDGWTLEAAEAVADTGAAQEILASLIDRSLVSSSEVDGTMRFWMLETVRVFCNFRLDRDTAKAAAGRFVDYFTKFAARRTDPFEGVNERHNHQELDRERENYEAVASLCEERLISVDTAAFCAGQLHLHWTYRGQAQVGIAMIERILAVETGEEPGNGYLLALQGLCVLTHDARESDKAERALVQLQAVADKQQNVEARFRSLTQSGNFFNKYGHFVEAHRHHSMALEASIGMNHPRMTAVVHCNLAEALFGLDRLDEAIDHWRISTEVDQANGNIAGEAMLYLGVAECFGGRLVSGANRLLIYLMNVHGLGFSRGYSRAIYYAAVPAVHLGEPELAAKLTASAKAFLIEEGHVIDAIESKCCAMVDELIARSGALPPPETLPIEDSVKLAERFLSSVK